MRALWLFGCFGRRCAPGGQPPFTPALVERLPHRSRRSRHGFLVALTRGHAVAPLGGRAQRRWSGRPGGSQLMPRPRSGGSPREGARSEARAEQRLAAGGRRLPRPEEGRAKEVSERGRRLPDPDQFEQTRARMRAGMTPLLAKSAEDALDDLGRVSLASTVRGDDVLFEAAFTFGSIQHAQEDGVL
jgi:hypothetical protein